MIHLKKIRAARPADLAQVIEIDALITGLRKPDYWGGVLKRYRGKFFLVFQDAALIQGYVVGEIRDWEFGAPPCGWVFGIGVRPQARLAGIGTRLLDGLCERFRAGGRAIDDADFRRAALRERVGDRPGAAAGADHHRRPRIGAPRRMPLQDVLHEPERVVVRAEERPVRPDDDAADGPDPLRDGINGVHHREGVFLVRNRDVAAGESEWGQAAQGGVEILGTDRQRHVRAGQTVLRHQVVVDYGRARVHDGPSHHAGEHELFRTGHVRVPATG